MAKSTTISSSGKTTTDPESLLDIQPQDQLVTVPRHRRLPTVALAALLTLLIACAAGVTFSVIAVLYSLRIGGDVPSRLLVFAASLVGIIYVVVHIRASRTHYTVTQSGPPWLYGNNLHTCALLLSRLGLALWVAAIVVTSLLIANTGISLTVSISAQTIYLNLAICAIAFPALCTITYCIEGSKTPFKTSALSRRSFLAGQPREEPEAFEDLSVSRRASIERAERDAIPEPRPVKVLFSFKKSEHFVDGRLLQTSDGQEEDTKYDFAADSPSPNTPEPEAKPEAEPQSPPHSPLPLPRAIPAAISLPLHSPVPAPRPMSLVPPVPLVPPIAHLAPETPSATAPAVAQPLHADIRQSVSIKRKPLTPRAASIKRKPVPGRPTSQPSDTAAPHAAREQARAENQEPNTVQSVIEEKDVDAPPIPPPDVRAHDPLELATESGTDTLIASPPTQEPTSFLQLSSTSTPTASPKSPPSLGQIAASLRDSSYPSPEAFTRGFENARVRVSVPPNRKDYPSFSTSDSHDVESQEQRQLPVSEHQSMVQLAPLSTVSRAQEAPPTEDATGEAGIVEPAPLSGSPRQSTELGWQGDTESDAASVWSEVHDQRPSSSPAQSPISLTKPVLHTIVVNEPLSTGLSRTARRVRKEALRARARKRPATSYSNFSRPLRYRGQAQRHSRRRSYHLAGISYVIQDDVSSKSGSRSGSESEGEDSAAEDAYTMALRRFPPPPSATARPISPMMVLMARSQR